MERNMTTGQKLSYVFNCFYVAKGCAVMNQLKCIYLGFFFNVFA